MPPVTGRRFYLHGTNPHRGGNSTSGFSFSAAFRGKDAASHSSPVKNYYVCIAWSLRRGFSFSHCCPQLFSI